MRIWFGNITLEDLQKRRGNIPNMGEFLGLKLTELGDDYLKGTLPVNERTVQPMGILHGGASCVLAESLGSMAAWFCVDPDKFFTVGMDIHTSHIRSIREGIVTGTARPIHLGKSTQLWEIKIENEQNQLISITRLTMFVKNRETA